MANMSYCRHENTSADLAQVIGGWYEWAEEQTTTTPSSESRARLRIIKMAVALTRTLVEDGLIDSDLDNIDDLDGAEFALIDPYHF